VYFENDELAYAMLWTNSINTGDGIGDMVAWEYLDQFLGRFPQIISKIAANSHDVSKVELAKQTLMYTGIYEKANEEPAYEKAIDRLLSAGIFTSEDLTAAHREYEAEG
jgi:hypothetical protein